MRILVARRPAARVAARATRAIRLADLTSARAGVDSPAPPSRWRPAGPAERFAVLGCYQARLPPARRVLAPPRRCSRTRRHARARSSLPEHARASARASPCLHASVQEGAGLRRRSSLQATPRTDTRRRVAEVRGGRSLAQRSDPSQRSVQPAQRPGSGVSPVPFVSWRRTHVPSHQPWSVSRTAQQPQPAQRPASAASGVRGVPGSFRFLWRRTHVPTATTASAASSQRSVRGPGCPRFLYFPGGAHTSVGRRVSHPPSSDLTSYHPPSSCYVLLPHSHLLSSILLMRRKCHFGHFRSTPSPASAASSPRQGGGPGAGPRLPNSPEGAHLVTAAVRCIAPSHQAKHPPTLVRPHASDPKPRCHGDRGQGHRRR